MRKYNFNLNKEAKRGWFELNTFDYIFTRSKITEIK